MNPEDFWMMAEEEDLLNLSSYTERQKRVVDLRYNQGLTYQQIADIFGFNRSRSADLLKKAHEKVLKHLSGKDDVRANNEKYPKFYKTDPRKPYKQHKQEMLSLGIEIA